MWNYGTGTCYLREDEAPVVEKGAGKKMGNVTHGRCSSRGFTSHLGVFNMGHARTWVFFFKAVTISANGLGPGGLDSERIPENERSWDSWGYPIRIPNHRAPKQQLTTS